MGTHIATWRNESTWGRIEFSVTRHEYPWVVAASVVADKVGADAWVERVVAKRGR